jgi:hypothetical protein
MSYSQAERWDQEGAVATPVAQKYKAVILKCTLSHVPKSAGDLFFENTAPDGIMTNMHGMHSNS